MKLILSYLTKQNITAFILILFCIQYIPIESRDGVSYLKLAVSLVCPLIMFAKAPQISKPVVYFAIYYILIILAAISHPTTLRWSTVLFMATFLGMYIAFYNLIVVQHAFSKEFFASLIRKLIYAYCIVLVLQQCLLIAGIKVFPLLNLVQDLKRGLGANSLTYEPSSVAVILSFAYLSLLRMRELDLGHKLTWTEVWTNERLVTLAFIYTMIGVVSGTAMAALAIIALYFVPRKNYILSILIVFIIALLFFNIDFLPLNRARDSFLAFLTLDSAKVMQADGSAAARIIPIVNTLTKLDLTTWEGWFGHGVDYGLSKWIFSERVMVGGIADYGFLSFLVMQFAVYSCMIKRFFSLETLLWACIGLMTLANVPLNWGAMMMFTVVRYFQTEYQNERCISNNS